MITLMSEKEELQTPIISGELYYFMLFSNNAVQFPSTLNLDALAILPEVYVAYYGTLWLHWQYPFPASDEDEEPCDRKGAMRGQAESDNPK